MLDPLWPLRIVESEHCRVTQTRTVRRTWRERLFTRPWRPWQATRTETYTEPSPEILLLTSLTPVGRFEAFLAHPQAVAQLRAEVCRCRPKTERKGA